MSAVIEIRVSGLDQVIDRLVGMDASVLRVAVAAEIEDQTVRRIDSEKRSPSGETWKSLDPDYAKRKAQNSSGGILELEGNLRESVRVMSQGEAMLVYSDTLYSATHQFGDTKRGIVARPFMGVSTENERDIYAVVDDWIKEAMRV